MAVRSAISDRRPIVSRISRHCSANMDTLARGRRRCYIEDAEAAAVHGKPVGTFTDWEALPEGSDLLFYEGLHGAVVSHLDTPPHESVTQSRVIEERRKHDGHTRGVDARAGWIPDRRGAQRQSEWIQKIHRDCGKKGSPLEQVTDTILGRLYDYVHYITPQSRSRISISSACRWWTLRTLHRHGYPELQRKHGGDPAA